MLRKVGYSQLSRKFPSKIADELQQTNPFWMPGIGLGIGYERGEDNGLTRDWLHRSATDNQRYPTPAEQIRQAQMQVLQEQAQSAQQQVQLGQERDRSSRLAARLRELGIDPDEV